MEPSSEKRAIAVDPFYFRPVEVDKLLGDATKAREILGWTPRITFRELVKMMVVTDLREAEKDNLCKASSYL
jgi:GDPmannose 4,6-dehydratase